MELRRQFRNILRFWLQVLNLTVFTSVSENFGSRNTTQLPYQLLKVNIWGLTIKKERLPVISERQSQQGRCPAHSYSSHGLPPCRDCLNFHYWPQNCSIRGSQKIFREVSRISPRFFRFRGDFRKRDRNLKSFSFFRL